MPLKSERSLLTVEFFAERGVEVTRPLQEWLNRALFVSKTRPDDVSRQRYEYWAISMVEKSLSHAVDWAKISPSMPSGAPEVIPRLLTSSASALLASRAQQTAIAGASRPSNVLLPVPLPPPLPAGDPWADRLRLVDECSKRCPPDLRPYVGAALSAFDQQVQLRRTTYANTSFTDVLSMCVELQRRLAPPQPRQTPLNPSTYNFSAPPPPPPPPVPMPSGPVDYRRSAPLLPPRAGLAVHTVTQHDLQDRHVSGQSVLLPPQYQQYNAQQSQIGRKRDRASPAASFSASSNTSSSDGGEASRRRAKAARREQEERALASTFFQSLIKAPPTNTTGAKKNRRIVGQSESLERLYSRDEPSAMDLRPRALLPDALAHVLHMSKERGTKYLSDQLKGMRQDLRCQNIKDEFTIGVYERHARLCLLLGNLSEFTQCQAALKKLYDEPFVTLENARVEEFSCFRLVYLAFGGQYDALAIELSNIVSFDKTQEDEEENAATDVDEEAKAAAEATHLRELQRAVGSCPSSKDSYSPPSSRDSLCSSDFDPDEDEPARHRFAALATASSILQAARLCIAVQDADSLMVVEMAREMGLHMQRLVRLFLQKQRVSWLMPLASASKGKIPMSTLLNTLGFLPNLNGIRQLSGKHLKKVLAPFSIGGGLSGEALEAAAAAAVEKHGFFIDGDRASAEKELTDFFGMLKLPLPSGFSYHHAMVGETVRFVRVLARSAMSESSERTTDEVLHAMITRGTAVSVDAAAVNSSVGNYVQFLTTRSDTNVADE